MKRIQSALIRFALVAALAATVGSACVGTAAPTPTATPQPDAVGFWLTVLHNSDAESRLTGLGGGLDDFGGVARFATLAQTLKAQAAQCPPGSRCGVIMLSAGDNYLVGPEFNASLAKQSPPFYDAIAMDLIGYSASAIGNHEFDSGPDALADFIAGFATPIPFVSANLDVQGEARLAELARAGRIAKSAVVTAAGEPIGIVGATTPALPFLSSPRRAAASSDVAAAVQAEVDALQARGVARIVLLSHLQSSSEDRDLAARLRGVDIIVGGGSGDLLANPGATLLPDDTDKTVGPYPMMVTDADGRSVPLVTTRGGYRYLGRLVAGFDSKGVIVKIDSSSGPVRVAGGANADAVAPDSRVEAQVVAPVRAYLDTQGTSAVATLDAPLDGRRASVRATETNLGDLMADALLWQATRLADSFGAPRPTIAILNGGAIRNDNVLTGGITELDVFRIAPFVDILTIAAAITPTQLKEILENAVSRVEFGDGRFPQVAGLSVVWDPTRQAQALDSAATVITSGARIRGVVLDDGTVVVRDGAVVSGAPSVAIATINFLTNGGDQYPYRGARVYSVGITYQQAAINYMREGLSGRITAARYPDGGRGRLRTAAAP